MGSVVDMGDPAPMVGSGPNLVANGSGLPNLLGVGTGRPVVTAAPSKPKLPLRVSDGVSAGMLLEPIRPVYPPIARIAGIQGTVVIEAIISKTGRIESLHVLSGPPMLREAAMSAVQAARYQPYRLSGEATEVQTTITVNFRLGS